MNYTTFRKAYNTLSDEYRFIIFNFLQKMEHAKDNPSDKIDYSHGLKIAMSEKELTINSLTFLIEEKTGYRDLRETIASMIERGSSSSAYFQDALDVLEIDEMLWSSIFVTLMANKIGGLQFGIYRNCQISSRVFHTAVAALPLTKANRSDFE